MIVDYYGMAPRFHNTGQSTKTYLCMYSYIEVYFFLEVAKGAILVIKGAYNLQQLRSVVGGLESGGICVNFSVKAVFFSPSI